jgi:hypothetical protein
MKSLPSKIQLNDRTYTIGKAEINSTNITVEYSAPSRGSESADPKLKFDVEDLDELEEKLTQLGIIVS